MTHFGDITKLRGLLLPRVEVIIGGFPLIWERINGAGSCLWASEFEEFCIAVTKHHFNMKEQT